MYLTNEFDLYKISFQYLLTYQKKKCRKFKIYHKNSYLRYQLLTIILFINAFLNIDILVKISHLQQTNTKKISQRFKETQNPIQILSPPTKIHFRNKPFEKNVSPIDIAMNLFKNSQSLERDKKTDLKPLPSRSSKILRSSELLARMQPRFPSTRKRPNYDEIEWNSWRCSDL